MDAGLFWIDRKASGDRRFIGKAELADHRRIIRWRLLLTNDYQKGDLPRVYGTIGGDLAIWEKSSRSAGP